MRSTSNKSNRFDDCTRFNWGYHDAAQAVREGWAVPTRNFGFGPTVKVNSPEDVLKTHHDKSYAEGWIRGYRDAKDGKYSDSSEEAWVVYKGIPHTDPGDSEYVVW